MTRAGAEDRTVLGVGEPSDERTQPTMTAPPTSIELGGRTYTVERPNARKASRAFALLRALSRAMPELNEDLAAFRRNYERNNIVELDRVQARVEFAPRPMTRDGELVLDEDGEPRMIPSPVDAMTEEDWERAGHVFRAPKSPTREEVAIALFDKALELGEDLVYRLLALFTIGNDDVARYRKEGTLDERLDERADELLDVAYADELLELAVVCGETVDHHFRRKAGALGDRVGKALNLFGLNTKRTSSTPTTTAPPSESSSPDGPSASKPSSSTDLPESTPDGDPTPSSTSPSTSSSSSAESSTTKPSDEPSRSMTTA